MKTVIFDIDGTLADLDHRLHYIKKYPKDYSKFYTECVNDSVITPIKALANIFHNIGTEILLVSGRSDVVRDETLEWLNRNDINFHALYMRKAEDYRSDVVVKSEILDEILDAGYEIDLVIDDRPSVVAMWRERGLTCLQCREWVETEKPSLKGLLTIMIGTAGAGKSTWLKSEQAINEYNIHASHVVSSDQIRADLCGDFKDQSKNDEVFAALHAVVRTRLSHGLPTAVDATNLRRKDRLACVASADGGAVRYIIIDRPMEQKQETAGWRKELPFDLIAKHQQTLNSQIKDILKADEQPNVTVIDLRVAA